MVIRKHSDSLKGIPHLDQLKGPRVYNFTHVTEERQWVKVSNLESLDYFHGDSCCVFSRISF